jgi:tetratricopeptide (TPR) repeat protein
MIICNNCGNTLNETQTFCGSCGAPNPLAHVVAATTPAAVSAQQIVVPIPSHDYQTSPLAPHAPSPYVTTAPVPSTGKRPVSSGLLIAVVALFAVAAVAAAVYLALSRQTEKMTAGGVSADTLAASLQSAVNSGNLVSPSGSGDAYSYYLELKTLDPNNKAIARAAESARTQLASMGEQLFTQKESVAVEKLTEQDWYKAERLYKWLRELEPGNRKHEARMKFAQGEIAKAAKNSAEAEARFSEAAQLDPSWATAHNSLGLVRVDMRKDKQRWADAVPFYQRAIDLRSDWVIPYNNMGTAYYMQGETNPANYNTAEYWYNQAISKNASWGRPYFWLGRIAEKRKNDYDAVTYYEKALSLDPSGYVFKPEERSQMQKKIDSWYGR